MRYPRLTLQKNGRAVNGGLAKWALYVVKNIKLEDSPEAAEYRRFYTEEAAGSKPSVRAGETLSGRF